MSITKVIVVYSKAQGRRRRLVVSDSHDDDYLYHLTSLHPREGAYEMPIDEYKACSSPEDIDVALERHIGMAAQSDRCVVVDNDGWVVCSVKADPNIDGHSSGAIVKHDHAGPGWKYVSGTWVPPAAVQADLPMPTDVGYYAIKLEGDQLSIGCETHALSEWASFKDSRIALMDIAAASWWKKHKQEVLSGVQKYRVKADGGQV